MQEGCCLNCDAPGPVGQPCGERICQKRGYNYIPLEHWQKLQGRTDDPIIGQVIDDYLIVDLLGAGGFGKVYLSLQQPLLKLKGALKLMETSGLPPQQISLFMTKFKGEGEALAELSHPNIVRLLKYGHQKNKPYLVMEYVDGGRTLASEFADRAMQGIAFEPGLIEHIIKQILDGLGAAHALKIIHRDIKPENIMLQNVYGNTNFVRILDFGLAKFIEERSKTSAALGTPAYIAPEQIEMRNIGPWTDLYAVGIILFELLTGRRPFAGDTFREIIAQKLSPSYDPISQISDLYFPEPFIDFFRRALARDPSHRIRSTSEFMKIFSSNMNTLRNSSQVTADFSLEEIRAQKANQQIERERSEIERDRKKLEAERKRLEAERRDLELSRQVLGSDDAWSAGKFQTDRIFSPPSIQAKASVPGKNFPDIQNHIKSKPENSDSIVPRIIGILLVCVVLLVLTISVLVAVKWDDLTGKKKKIAETTSQNLTSAEDAVNGESDGLGEPENLDSEKIKNQIEPLLEDGRIRMSEEDWDQASEIFTQVLRLDPDNTEARRERDRSDNEKPFKKMYNDTIIALR